MGLRNEDGRRNLFKVCAKSPGFALCGQLSIQISAVPPIEIRMCPKATVLE